MTEPTELRFYSAADVTRVFDLDTAIESQRVAFGELGLGNAQLPARLLMNGPDDSVAFCYAARVSAESGPVCKFGSVVPANTALGLPSISALVVALDPDTGQPAAIMDGTTVTTIRTSAASAVAAEHLAPAGSTSLAIIGSGVQAEAHARAISRLLPLRQIQLWSPETERCAQVAARLDAQLEATVTVASSIEAMLGDADVVAGCTTSSRPVFEADWLKAGALVISVGSFAADRREVPDALVDLAALVVVDDIDTALEHAGPIVKAVADGRFDPVNLMSLGSIVAAQSPGRTDDEGVVYYNSVGIGLQDAAAAWAIVTAAKARDMGTVLTL